MENLILKIEHVILFDPEKRPNKPKPSEIEQMDAKNLLFYPALKDINIQRNLIGMAEGILLFFNNFKDEEEDIDLIKSNVELFALKDRFMLFKQVEDSIILVLIFRHKITGDFSNTIKNHEYFKIELFDELMNDFLNIYYILFGNFSQYFKNDLAKINFTERFFCFIESYFKISDLEIENEGVNFNIASTLSLLTRKKNYSAKILSNLISLKIILKNKYKDFSNLIVYNDEYLVFGDFNKVLLSIINSFVVESNFLIKKKYVLTQFFIDFFKINEETFNNSTFSLLNNNNLFKFHANKHNLSKTIYFSVLIHNSVVVFCFWKTENFKLSVHNEIFHYIKNLEFKKEKEKNIKNLPLYITYLNNLTATFTNSSNLFCLNKMNKIFIFRFFEEFIKINKGDYYSIYNFQIQIEYKSFLFNFLNDRIILLFSDNNNKSEINDKFEEIKNSLNLI